ncbi:MAG: GAF domain-containing protein, partial [Ginsengibacter sp.]
DFGLKVVEGTETPKSLLYVPLIVGNKVTSYVSLQNVDKENAFKDSDVRLLETLANSMSVALENARLFDETNRLLKETEQHTAELAVINSVQEGLAKELDMQSIYDLVGDRIRHVFDAQAVMIATLDEATGMEQFNYLLEKGTRFYLPARKYDKLRQALIDSKQKILINENTDEANKRFGTEIVEGTEDPKSLLFVPLIMGDKVKSYVSLQNIDKENAFSDSDVRLLETLSNSMSVALENARLFDETNRLLKETEQRTSELAVINSVQEGLVAQMDMQSIYDLVGEKIRHIFNAQIVDIVTYDKTKNLIEDRYAYEKGDRTLLEAREPKGFRRHVINSRQPLVINKDLEKHMAEYDNVILIGEIPKSNLFVPLILRGEVNGIISLQNTDQENAFSDSDVSLLTTLANSMSVALESASLFHETNRLLKETEQRTAELAVINSVQEGLAKELNIQGIYDLVGNKIRDLFDAQAVAIGTFNHEAGTESFNFLIEKGDRFYPPARPLGKLRLHLIQTKKKILLNTQEDGISWFGREVVAGTEPIKSGIFVPLMIGDKITSYVSLQNIDKEYAFNDSDIRLLETLANSMSVALENARLFDETNRLLKETEQRTAELAVINSVQDGLAKELDMQGIYDLVGDRVQQLFQTHAVIIASFDLANKTEHFNYVFENGEKYVLDSRPVNKLRELLINYKQTIYIETEASARDEFGITAIADTKMPKSLMFVPLLAGNNIKGYVSIQNIDKENAFTTSDIRLLETLSNSMSVALENARLFDETNRLLKETEQRTAELAVINSVQEGLVKEFQSQGIYQLVGEKLCELFDTQTVLIRTFDQETGLETWRYAIEKGQRQYSDPRPLIWANKQLIATHKPILINENYLDTAKKFGGTGVSMGQAPKSAVFVPMIVGDIVRGSVSLQNVDKEFAFSEADVKLLTTLTNSMGVALENARLFDETSRLLDESKQRANELLTVNNISQALASQLNIDEIIKLVGNQMKDLFKANIVYLALLDKNTRLIHFPYQFGDEMPPQKLGEGLTSKILQTGEALLINKDVGATTEELGVSRMGLPAASYLGVPIPADNEIIGVLSVQSTQAENQFTENNQRLLSTIAASVGVALNKAQLFEDVTSAKQQAEEASKIAEKANEAKSAFLSTVSHELRTPLTSVLGFTKIIRKRLEEKIFPSLDRSDVKTEKVINQISENLNVVISEGERLTHLINDVLDLAKIEAGKMEWTMENVTISEVAGRAISATTSLFDQKNLKLEKDIQSDLPSITGDRDKLIQVIINLLSNAIKFTDKGTVGCKIFKESDEVIVQISDTGIGIAPEDFAAVFEQFKQVGGDTLTDKPKGTGLGLPICKEIVEHHGGRIWLESAAGKGSTFSFALPLIPTHAQPIHLNQLLKQLKEQMAQSKIRLDGKIATILVVDDDDSIRSLLNQELSEAGYLIEQASNGKDALEKVRNNKPDLIILDVMMPEMNGFDVAAVLKNDPQTMDIPIIILSIVQDKARGYRIGVDRYLTKPIDTAQLFSEVGTLLEQGKSKKKVMVVDEDIAAVRTLTHVLETKGYNVVESDGEGLLKNAITNQPDIIILNSVHSDKQKLIQTLRFEKGLEHVLFLIYQ